jgi:hypothetical protein
MAASATMQHWRSRLVWCLPSFRAALLALDAEPLRVLLSRENQEGSAAPTGLVGAAG